MRGQQRGPEAQRQHVVERYEELVADYSGEYETPAGRHYRERKVAEFLRRFPKRDPASLRVLEIGSADGVYTREFGRLGYRVVAMDLAHAQLRRAQQRAGPASTPLVQAEAEQLPFRAQSFDLVISMCTLRYLTHVGPALAEIERCLAPGGTLVADVPNQWCPFFVKYWRPIFRLRRLLRHGTAVGTLVFTPRTIAAAVRCAGFANFDQRTMLLTTRTLPDWCFALLLPCERMFERVAGLRSLAGIIVFSAQKPAPGESPVTK